MGQSRVVPILLIFLAMLQAPARAGDPEGGLQPFLGEPHLDRQPLFETERFPNIVVTVEGTVLATWGSSRVVARRSEDGGATWGPVISIADPGFHGGGTTVDESSGDILVFVEDGHPPAAMTQYRSRDDGRTWEAEEFVVAPDRNGHLPSLHMNEHGITLRHGPKRGRLLRPARYYGARNDREEWPNHYTNAIYSDDGGRSWKTSDPFPENGTGEATVAELADGRIYYNSRVHWQERPQNTRRREAWSRDGGETWTDWRVVEILPDGHQHRSYGCMGGLVRLPVRGQDILIFSNIDTPNATRERATVWASFDGGRTWPVKRLVFDGRSAYSSLTAGRPETPSEGWIYLHFEGGPDGASHVARFNLAWLLEGEETGDGSVPAIASFIDPPRPTPEPVALPASTLNPYEWSELPTFPDPVGVAAPFAGISNDALIVAGGANFPGGRPWEGHPKVWHDRIFVMPAQAGAWAKAATTLPRPTAYGISLTWERGDAVVCLGGGNAATHYTDAYLLRWTGSEVAIETLPELPVPIAFSCGALHEDTAYVFGGIPTPGSVRCLDRAFALDLAAEPREWIEIESWPGPERYLSAAGAQDGHLYLMGGIRLEDDGSGNPRRVQPFLRDVYRYTPGGQWTRVADLPHPVAAAPSPAVPVGPAHLFLLGGDDGTGGGARLKDAHPGFSPGILAYHTITDTWTPAGQLPKDLGPDPAGDPAAGTWPPVTTPTVVWRGHTVLPSGEARPGVRTARVMVGSLRAEAPRFGWLNYTVLVVYLAALVVMGIYFSRREKTTGDFFLGGKRVPWWAAGISIFGTQLSAITFLAIPAKTFATDWLYFLQNLGIVAVAPIVVFLCLPFYRRLDVTSAYEYLEHRFHLLLRIFGALSFIAFQLARMGIVMFLPALALAAVTGIDISICILVMGVLCTVYTVLGGIEAVIWTDVLQVFVLIGGGLCALAIVVMGIDGGVSGLLEAARESQKLRLVDLRWDWTGPALGVILLGAVFNNLVPYTADQAVVQRYLTTADEKRAAGAVWTGALLSVPASLLFFSVGTALFAFYSSHPDRLQPLGPTDQIFAWFIVSELPAGLAGLVVAGVFAAAMSSLDSSMNSISAVVTSDLYRRFRSDRDEGHYLRLARGITLVLGIAGTATALWMAQSPVQSLWDAFLGYVGLLGGTMAGLLVLGMISTRATTGGACVGALAAVATLTYAKVQTDVSGLLYAAIGMVTCVVVGYAASWVLRSGPRNLQGLTIHSRA